LAFGKLRWIAGDERLAGEASQTVAGLHKRFAGSPGFVSELRAVRRRIADSSGIDSIKAAPGGLYDVDFILGMLEACADLPAAGNQMPERLAVLRETELLTEAQVCVLLHAAGLFRRVDHAIRLVEGRSRKWVPESDILRAGVERLVGCPELDVALRSEMREVRAIFNLILGD
jgi:glutamine synthetase adenylyltransferase